MLTFFQICRENLHDTCESGSEKISRNEPKTLVTRKKASAIFRKTNISYPLIRSKLTDMYIRWKNSFLENLEIGKLPFWDWCSNNLLKIFVPPMGVATCFRFFRNCLWFNSGTYYFNLVVTELIERKHLIMDQVKLVKYSLKKYAVIWSILTDHIL